MMLKKNILYQEHSETTTKMTTTASRKYHPVGLCSLILFVLLLSPGMALPELKRSRSVTQSKNSVASNTITNPRCYPEESAVVEMNPEYIHYTPPSPAPTYGSYGTNEHDEWLRQQQQQQNFNIATTTYQQRPAGAYKGESLLDMTRNYLQNLHTMSPTLFWTTLSCVAIFILWGLPVDAPFLAKLLVCSRQNVWDTKGLSLILPAISHISFRHLALNLFTLLQIGPSVRQEIVGRSKPIWPLLLSSAVASHMVFLSKPAGACLGLSGVTMALIAVLASSFPNRMFGIVVGVFPVRLPARHILQILLAVSCFGAFFPNRSGIAHLTHLGGLMYGILYHELFVKRKMTLPTITFLRQQKNTNAMW